MTNWDINDMESAYNQDEKKSKQMRVLVTLPTPCPFTKLPLNMKMQQTPKQLLLIVHFTGNRRDKRQKNVYINYKKEFIPAKKIEVKKTGTTVFREDIHKR